MQPKDISRLIAATRQKLEVGYRTSITAQQLPYQRDRPAKGPVWVSRVKIPGNGAQDIVEAVQEAIRLLGDGSESYDVPDCVELTAEWVGHRSGADSGTGEPNLSDQEKYQEMMRDSRKDWVILYAHGGASYVGNSASSRMMTSKLSSLTGSRVFSVNYRLAPQHPFPSQLVDLILAYFFLLHPPLNAQHTAIPSSKIVFVGDSFGGTLWLALTQIILALNPHPQLPISTRPIRLRGSDIPLPLPAGIALVSAYGYTPHVFPSWTGNELHDSFPILPHPFCNTTYFPSCAAWPTTPARGDIYCETSMLSHPLVCPSTAKSWKGCPPMYLGNGQEGCLDSIAVVAAQAVRDEVVVSWEMYEGMCHVFMSFFPKWRQSEMCYKTWTSFVGDCVERPEILRTKGRVIGIEDLRESEVEVRDVSGLGSRDAIARLSEEKERRRPWSGPTETRKSVL